MARAQHGDAGPVDGYIPFLDRFKRWWRGDDGADAGDGIALIERGSGTGNGAGQCAITVDPADAGQWTDARVAFCRKLWATSDDDDEIVEPGSAVYCNTLLTPAGINSTKSVLDLSAGLGGGVRYLVGALGLWVTAADPEPELVKRAQQISVKRGLGKRAPISVYDPDALIREFVDTMMREAEYWLSLERALGSGALVYLHCHATVSADAITR